MSLTFAELNDPAYLVALAAAGGGVAFLLAFFAVRSAWDARQRRLEEHLRAHPDSLPGLELPTPHSEKDWSRYFDEGLQRMAETTGFGMTGPQWLALMLMLGLALAGGLYLWQSDLNFALGGLVFGAGAPFFVLMIARQRVRRQMQQQLPDAYYFLARSLRAGLSFEQAMRMVASESPEPLAGELRRVAEHLKLGLAPVAAAQLAAVRIGLPDFQMFVAALGLFASTGGNLAALLDRLAATTRDRNQYLGYFRSATALGRTSAIAIGCAVPVLFLGYLFFEPEYAQRFFESSTGIALLATAFGLEIVGVTWLWWLLRVDY